MATPIGANAIYLIHDIRTFKCVPIRKLPRSNCLILMGRCKFPLRQHDKLKTSSAMDQFYTNNNRSDMIVMSNGSLDIFYPVRSVGPTVLTFSDYIYS